MSPEGTASAAPVPAPGGVPPAPGTFHDLVIQTLKSCYDPELPLNIYELGLIYNVAVTPANDVSIAMTLTTPNCPVIESLPSEIRRKVAAMPGAGSVTLDIVWDPPWSPDRMSDAAKLELGLL